MVQFARFALERLTEALLDEPGDLSRLGVTLQGDFGEDELVIERDFESALARRHQLNRSKRLRP